MALRKIMVLFGGVSTEHIVSLRSAYNIISGLRQAGLQVLPVGITRSGDWLPWLGSAEAIRDGSWEREALAAAAGQTSGPLVRSPRGFITSLHGIEPDCIFPAVHGINCEDGTLQGLLELTGIPYVGCGVLASAAGMDKLHAKTIFRASRIPQLPYVAVNREDIKRRPAAAASKVAAQIGFPCFLKPNNGGSSVGTCRADDLTSLEAALTMVGTYDRIVLVESFVNAREIEVAVLGNERPQAAVIGEIATSQDVAYYDYEAKYFKADGAAVIVPADLDTAMAARVRRLALKAYKALGCSGLSRVDFFLSRDNGKLYINEINTLPGFTPISVYPKAFAASGLPIDKLVKKLCQLAVSAKQARVRQELI